MILDDILKITKDMGIKIIDCIDPVHTILNNKGEEIPLEKCPYNKDIDCVAGFFCDGCKHEFDDEKEA